MFYGGVLVSRICLDMFCFVLFWGLALVVIFEGCIVLYWEIWMICFVLEGLGGNFGKVIVKCFKGGFW